MSDRTDHFFIYPRDTKGNRTGHTICVLLREGKMFHGVALCSKKDSFEKVVGRELAHIRALEAYNKHLEKEQQK